MASGPQQTILVVDDNEMNRDMLSRRLTRKGYTVLTADDGQPALDLVAQQPVDLVLLDVMMPGMDGLQALRRLRERFSQSELPVIMATAKDASEDVVAALDQGANDYVTKPIDFPVVLARVQAQLRTRAAAAEPAASNEPSIEELAPGVTLAGRFELGEVIGEGAYGTVFRARHLALEREVAVKVLQPDLMGKGDALERFRREGVSACRVEHQNAVAVSDFGVTEGRVAYLVMELLAGRSLEQELRRVGPLSPRRTAAILRPICEVLAAAHEAGIVHRDIKPENVFLHRDRRGEVVKVLDFGIAKLADETPAGQQLTSEGLLIGTLAYMAPERLRDQPYDGRSDVYSLGIMLYRMLAGRLPFVAEHADPLAVVMKHVNEPLPSLASVAPPLAALDEVVARAASKDPAARPTPAQLAVDFAAAARVAMAAGAGGTEASSSAAASAAAAADDLPTQALDTTDLRPQGGLIGRLVRRLRKP